MSDKEPRQTAVVLAQLRQAAPLLAVLLALLAGWAAWVG